MTVERYHRWAAGRWERRDRVNRVSSSIPSTFSPSFLPSFLPRFAHARTRYVNSALERLFNGSRPRQRESGKKKKKKKGSLAYRFRFRPPFPASKADAASIPSLLLFFPSLFSYFFPFDSTRLDSASLSRRNCTRRGDIFDYPGRYIYTGLPHAVNKTLRDHLLRAPPLKTWFESY